MEPSKTMRLVAQRVEELRMRSVPENEIMEDIKYHLKTIKNKHYSEKFNSFYTFMGPSKKWPMAVYDIALGDKWLWFTFNHEGVTYCGKVQVATWQKSREDTLKMAIQMAKDQLSNGKGKLYGNQTQRPNPE